MKTFLEFLEIIQEKKKEPSKKEKKKLVKGIVVQPEIERSEDGTITYSLKDQPRPVDTKPGSTERRVQTREIESHGAKEFKKKK
jgi:hypothetical protein